MKRLLFVLILSLVGFSGALAASLVTVYSSGGTLADGFNILAGGGEYFLPANMTGAKYQVVNEAGQPVSIVPGAANLRVGTLPVGHKGVLAAAGTAEIVDIGQGRYFLWQGVLSDGGEYYNTPAPTPTLWYSSPILAFGTVLENTLASKTLTVANTGGADLILGAVATANPLEGPFTLQGNCTSNSPLAPGESCALTVQFLPSAAGLYQDSFDIPSNDPGSPVVTINVSGEGVALGASVARTDFSTVNWGSGIPTGWTERWDVGKASYSVMAAAAFQGRNQLLVNETSMARRLVTYDVADGLGSDVDMLILFKDPVNDGSNHADFRFYARAAGQLGTESAYFFTSNSNQQQVAIYRYVNGVLTPLVGAKEKIAINAVDPWWVRFRAEGSLLRAKIWPYGSVEPRDWQLSVSDASITSAGLQGIGTYYLGDHIFYEFSAAALPEVAAPVNGFGIVALSPAAVNLNAESGNTIGWQNEFGTLQATPNYQRTGSYCFQGGKQDYRAFQRIGLAQSGVTPAHLANGAKFSFRAWQQAFGSNNDPGRIGLRFLDAAQQGIAEYYTNWDSDNFSYVSKSLIETIPGNAAFVDIILEGRYMAGGATGAYFDDLEVTIGVK